MKKIKSEKPHQIIIKTPSHCTELEIINFYRLVEQGGEVQTDELSNGIQKAKFLGFFYINSKVVGIGALRYTPVGFQKDVFERAVVPTLASKYNFEIGYFVTKKEYRRQGISQNLLKKLLQKAPSQNIYSTARTENTIMNHILEKNHFKKIGKPFLGRHKQKGRYYVQLYVLAS